MQTECTVYKSNAWPLKYEVFCPCNKWLLKVAELGCRKNNWHTARYVPDCVVSKAHCIQAPGFPTNPDSHLKWSDGLLWQQTFSWQCSYSSRNEKNHYRDLDFFLKLSWSGRFRTKNMGGCSSSPLPPHSCMSCTKGESYGLSHIIEHLVTDSQYVFIPGREPFWVCRLNVLIWQERGFEVSGGCF